MNLPNKLTVLRVIMIPFFVVSLLAFHGEVRLTSQPGSCHLHCSQSH